MQNNGRLSRSVHENGRASTRRRNGRLPKRMCEHIQIIPTALLHSARIVMGRGIKKTTKIQLELITDPTMHLFFEKGTRGGVSVVTKRHAVANNKYMKDYDPNKENVYIIYLDANNFYGWAMSEPLPTHGFEWMTDELTNWRDIPCELEVDIEYPDELHDLHNDMPLVKCPY